ncbi:type III pantothenate kinase [SAR202 cluster bacterium AD-804-J14_MRT_500m]|nr:type III pantothenate kinase [SAR202 cluster bacterium AD-804-J14_MRT_500m]
MLLTIDIGNTNANLGVFDGHNLVCTCRLSADNRRMTDEYGLTLTSILGMKGIELTKITGAAICSVVPPLTSTFEKVCLEYFDVTPLVVGAGVKTGVRILSDNPREVGTDRVVDAVAAYRLYGGPSIVVDFGTATVFDAISKEGDYLGGAIAPGIEVAAEALHQATAQLRRVDMSMPKAAIGRNTAASLQSGLLLGYLSMVEGMVKRLKAEMEDEVKVVATGGLSTVFEKETEVFDATNPDLTLIGLRMVYEMNQDGGTF